MTHIYEEAVFGSNSPQTLLSTGLKNYMTEGTLMDRFMVGTNTSKNTEEVVH